ncbi:type III secretion system stalk subunit SctO [Chthonobacter rhizosphaerae]|uniref:type III secretion system stalk subunit SctO n=1 Tax=Chthonobacter rhizosphaerae TaxID=2735553 RepID=UPI0015EE8DC4|nr:YscO family type III secretion system apparatus protein [Chthonobacter rhizosphaerae]
MIGQIRTLLRVKTLKEEQAFRAVRRKRAELAQAEAAVAEAERRVRESAAALPARETAVYAPILGSVVPQGALQDARDAVVALRQAHLSLVDGVDASRAAARRIAEELEAARNRHREIQKQRDKYVILSDSLAGEAAATAAYGEEVEIEDLVSARRRRIA